MNNIIKKYLFAAILAFLTLSPNTIFAEFGESCTTVFNSNQLDIETKSLYGYLIKNIKIKGLKDDVGCKIERKEGVKQDSITVGFRKNEYGDEVVNKTLKTGDEIKISEINGSYISSTPILQDIKIKAEKSSDEKSLCLTLKTQYGKAYLVCRPLEKKQKSEEEDYTPKDDCSSTIAKSCFQTSKESRSKNYFSFSGQLMECVRESVSDIIYQNKNCPKDKIKYSISSISTFRSELSRYVGFMLTIYIIFYGFRMAADPANFSSQDVIVSVIKVLVVIALTSGPNFGFSNGINKNLLDEYFLPLALDLMDIFSSSVINATKSSLCAFNSAEYQEGYKYYALFDSIDCRISTYFVIPPQTSEETNFVLTFPVVVFCMLISGHIVLFLCLVTFGIFFIDIVFKFIAAVIIYIVTLYAMVYVSILYIPTILFEKTREYYDSWQRVVISMIIQPFVVTTFLVMFFNVFDNILFKDCVIDNRTDENGKIEFYISDNTKTECKNSFGYTLLEYRKKENWRTVRLILFKIYLPKLVSGFGNNNPFVYIEIVIWIIIFQFVMRYAYTMAAEISSGPSVMIESLNESSDKKNKKVPEKKAPQKKGDKDKTSSGGGDKDGVSSEGGGGDKDGVSSEGGGGDKDQTPSSGDGDKDQVSSGGSDSSSSDSGGESSSEPKSL